MKLGLLCLVSVLIASSALAVELLMRVAEKPVGGLSEEEARIGRSLPGMFIVMKPDGHTWGSKEAQPDYIIIKLPNVTNLTLLRTYLQAQMDTTGTNMYRYREWRWPTTNLTTLQQRLLTNNSVTVKASGGDFSWARFRTNLFNLRTGLVETNDLE